MVEEEQQPTHEELHDIEVLKRAFRPRGSAIELFGCRKPEIVVHGPSGTGKSRACLEKLYAAAQKYPGMRGAIVRKFRSSITQSALNTFDELVRLPGDQVKFNTVSQEYTFKNGSVIVVAGLDDPTKILSTEFDIIYAQECTEIEESTWEMLTTRLRWNHMPYQQIIGDCNPSSQKHWIIRRERIGRLYMIQSKYEDNPLWWDIESDDWTEAGAAYISKLDAMTGHMYQRFRLGNWVGAEGLIYSEYSAKVNLVPAFPIPDEWPRYVSIDWGYQNPMSVGWFAEDYDGRLYLYREFYQTHVAVEDMAHEFYTISKGESYQAIICDQDEEDRFTFERHAGHPEYDCIRFKDTEIARKPRGRHVSTVKADKSKNSVRAGIEKVQNRFKVAGDGRPRLFIFQQALISPDEQLKTAKKPLSLEDEIEDYIWDKIDSSRVGEKLLESPRKINDHACDMLRYAVAYIDSKVNEVSPNVWGAKSKNTYSGRHPTKPVETIWGKSKSSFWS